MRYKYINVYILYIYFDVINIDWMREENIKNEFNMPLVI